MQVQSHHHKWYIHICKGIEEESTQNDVQVDLYIGYLFT